LAFVATAARAWYFNERAFNGAMILQFLKIGKSEMVIWGEREEGRERHTNSVSTRIDSEIIGPRETAILVQESGFMGLNRANSKSIIGNRDTDR
jgi:hypothetical protein